MIPHVIGLEPGLVITRFTTATGSSVRPTMEDLRQVPRTVSKKRRSDITTPQLRAAWQQGRKEFFYPYDKTDAQTLGERDLGRCRRYPLAR
jgi:hypothetical protein